MHEYFTTIKQTITGRNTCYFCLHDHHRLIRRQERKEEKMDYINAFWVGGLICALVQILMEKTKMMPGRIMVTLVCVGAIISFFGWYDMLIEKFGAGVTVPLLGFGHNLMKGVKEAVDENGFIGLFMGGFKAAAVGSSAALIFGYLASLIFNPKMKK